MIMKSKLPDNRSEYIYPLVVLVGIMLFFIPTASLLLQNAYTGYVPPRLIPAATGQDIITLFISPILLLLIKYRKKDHSPAIIIGILIYSIYVYSLYAFAALYNYYFLFYITIIGLSFYSIIVIYWSIDKEYVLKKSENKMINVLTGSYLISVGIIIALLWIYFILRAVISHIPVPGINSVYVLDLTIILPAFIISGIQLLQRKYQSYINIEIMLVFIIILGISILSGFILSFMQGFAIGIGQCVMFTLFTVIGLLLYKLNYYY